MLSPLRGFFGTVFDFSMLDVCSQNAEIHLRKQRTGVDLYIIPASKHCTRRLFPRFCCCERCLCYFGRAGWAELLILNGADNNVRSFR